MNAKKITKATVKSFIRKNANNLYINVKSSFDGMTDCCESLHNGFVKAKKEPQATCMENSMGIAGAWFVGNSGDWFSAFENDNLTGIEVSNCCGHFILAIEK